MARRFFVFVLLLAALATGTTFFHLIETKETLSEPGLADMVRVAQVHGWPWGYFAEVREMTRLDERSVAVFEYNDLRWQMLGQTYLAWFVISLALVSAIIGVTDPARRRN